MIKGLWIHKLDKRTLIASLNNTIISDEPQQRSITHLYNECVGRGIQDDYNREMNIVHKIEIICINLHQIVSEFFHSHLSMDRELTQIATFLLTERDIVNYLKEFSQICAKMILYNQSYVCIAPCQPQGPPLIKPAQLWR